MQIEIAADDVVWCGGDYDDDDHCCIMITMLTSLLSATVGRQLVLRRMMRGSTALTWKFTFT